MGIELRKYGVSTTVRFPLVKASSQNFAVSGDYTHASGDVKISKDGGAAATATNSPSAVTMGNGAYWTLTLTATEMEAAEVIVTVIDAATKAVEDQMIKLHTYGHASAMIVADLSAANLAANVTQFGGTNGTFSGGRPETNVTHWNGTAVTTPNTAGTPVVDVGRINNVSTSSVTTVKPVQGLTTADTIATYTGNTPQTGDAFARIGATGSGLTSLAPAATALSSATWTATRAGYLDNLSGGAPPSAAAIATQVDTTLSGTHGAGSWATATGFSTLDAVGVRNAIGLAAANLDAQLGAILATTGAGAYTRTITVNDGTAALQGAKVRLSQGAESYVGTTNASGQVVFAVDAATWSVAITKSGYTFTPTTLAVSGSGSTTYSMTASGPAPSAAPDKTTVRITCYGADTEPEASATVQLRQLTAPSGDEGNAFDGAWTTYTADASGIVDVTLWSDCTYAIRRGATGDVKQFTPTGTTDSFASVLSR